MYNLVLQDKYLNENENEIVIHPNCQKQVTNELRRYHKTPKEDNAKVPRLSNNPRSSVPDFDWRKNCLFCSKGRRPYPLCHFFRPMAGNILTPPTPLDTGHQWQIWKKILEVKYYHWKMTLEGSNYV